ncbi:hypothetical protein BGZ65_011302, partial [Modicella reniformis]
MDTKHAAFGVDLSGASRVYFVSPVWQTATMRQAVKRAHRIGQTRPVHVETLVIKDSFEEAILNRRSEIDNEEVSDSIEKSSHSPLDHEIRNKRKQHVSVGSGGKGMMDDGKMREFISHIDFMPLPSRINAITSTSTAAAAASSGSSSLSDYHHAGGGWGPDRLTEMSSSYSSIDGDLAFQEDNQDQRELSEIPIIFPTKGRVHALEEHQHQDVEIHDMSVDWALEHDRDQSFEHEPDPMVIHDEEDLSSHEHEDSDEVKRNTVHWGANDWDPDHHRLEEAAGMDVDYGHTDDLHGQGTTEIQDQQHHSLERAQDTRRSSHAEFMEAHKRLHQLTLHYKQNTRWWASEKGPSSSSSTTALLSSNLDSLKMEDDYNNNNSSNNNVKLEEEDYKKEEIRVRIQTDTEHYELFDNDDVDEDSKGDVDLKIEMDDSKEGLGLKYEMDDSKEGVKLKYEMDDSKEG